MSTNGSRLELPMFLAEGSVGSTVNFLKGLLLLIELEVPAGPRN